MRCIQQNDARGPAQMQAETAWLNSPTGIIRSGYEGMFSALEIEAPLRQCKCTNCILSA